MYSTRDQLLALRPYGSNTICLSMRPRSGKHPKQIGSDATANNLITVPIKPYTDIESNHNNGTAVQNVTIGLIKCQSICNKSDEISDVVKDMDLDALVITQTWLTVNVSDQKIVGDVTPVGYSFHHAARIHKKGGGESAFFSMIL